MKWAGGKSQLLDQYHPFFPQTFQTYYEPFLGGGAVFFKLQPEQAVLTDINLELVNVYQCIRDHVDHVLAKLWQHQQCHGQDYYYHIRSQPPDDPVDRAARLIYLNKTCFNGLYRENSKGQFNVPIGRYTNPRIYHPELLHAVSRALQVAQIEVRAFTEITKFARSDQDFVYFDPPYHPISATSRFTAYSRFKFGEAEQIALRDTFMILASRGVKVMLSNSDCPFIRELYNGFSIHTIQATRAINSNPNRRGLISEVLITSYEKPT